MPRATSPLVSSISGSLRNSVTFRNNPQTPDIVIQKRPVPTGAPTAAQLAVRNAYSRLAWLWKNLPNLDKKPYEIMAEARNLTPWNCWLSFHMPLMRLTPKFYTAFSEGAGSSIQDFAIGGLSGTAGGTVWQEKNQFPHLSFDGIDDSVTFNRPGYYDAAADYSIYVIVQPNDPWSATSTLLCTKKQGGWPRGFFFLILADKRPYMEWGNGTVDPSTFTTELVKPGEINSLFYSTSGYEHTFIANGIIQNRTSPYTGMVTSEYPLSIGTTNVLTNDFKGKILISAIFPTRLNPTIAATLDAHYLPFFT